MGVALAIVAGYLLGTFPSAVLVTRLATLVTAISTLDGESHWFEGVQLLAVYAMIAVAAFFV